MMNVLEEIQRIHQQIDEATCTIVCSAKHEHMLRSYLVDHGLDHIYFVAVSPYCDEDRMYCIRGSS